ncbi:MAG: hypothetical protein HZA16_11650 [Nitrospirae bacterium]|nr:hypothetical protein [Nitrospirota bacterium]
MKEGNWIPMDKSLVAALPKTRPYTLIEAAFSYQLDLNNGTVKAFREYERVWGWSFKKVMNFISFEAVTLF